MRTFQYCMQVETKEFSFKELLGNIKFAITLKKLLLLGFGLILISWLLAQLDWAAARDVLQKVPPHLLIAGFACYAASFYLRAQRFKLFLPEDKAQESLFSIVLVHYTALNILPARLGELSYVFLTKKIHNTPSGQSLASLLLARIFDHFAISLLFLIASFTIRLSSPWLRMLNIFVGGGLIVILLLLLLLLAYKGLFAGWLKGMLVKFGFDRYAIIRRIIVAIDDIVASLKTIQLRPHFQKAFGFSVLIWLGIFGVNYCLLTAFSVELSFMEIVLASTFIILMTILPIRLPGGVGIHETTWTFIAVALGVPKDIAIVSAFGTHIVSIIYLFIFGAYGLWRLRASFKIRSDTS